MGAAVRPAHPAAGKARDRFRLARADVRARLDRTFLSNNIPAGVAITSATAASPAVLTIGTASPIATGSTVTVVDIVGDMGSDRLNSNTYWVSVIAGLSGVSATRIALYSDAAMWSEA